MPCPWPGQGWIPPGHTRDDSQRGRLRAGGDSRSERREPVGGTGGRPGPGQCHASERHTPDLRTGRPGSRVDRSGPSVGRRGDIRTKRRLEFGSAPPRPAVRPCRRSLASSGGPPDRGRFRKPCPKLRSDRGRPDVCAPRVFRSDRAAPPHRRNWKRSWRAPRPTNASDWWINCFRTTAAMRSTG